MSIPYVKFYLDTRRVKGDGLAKVKAAICHKRKVAYIGTNVIIKPSQWDSKAEKVIKHPQKVILSDFLNSTRIQINGIILRLYEQGKLTRKPITEIKRMIESILNGGNSETAFIDYFTSFISKKSGRTKELYETTLKRLREFHRNINLLSFEDITPQFLTDFDKNLSISSPSKNARNIHLRNIRAVFNDAIKNEATQYYPFRKFIIKGIPTKKRSLTLDQLRYIFSIENSSIQIEIDMFKLMFLLIGINVTDLFNIETMINGRIEYCRAKTHKLYSVKVEPEAMAIIQKYRGKDKLLDISERHTNIKAFKTNIDRKLKRIFPALSTYWARHSWATVAADLDIPIETIAHALGHSYGSEVTSIYIRFNEKKVDEANRRIIDYVLNNCNYKKE